LRILKVYYIVILNQQQRLIMKAIKLNETSNAQLDELTKKRKGENNLVATKKGLVAQLIDAAYKREVR
jgi:hypothetical protein